MYKNEESILLHKSQRFAVRITKMAEYLSEKNKLFLPLYSQVLRSGTSIMANVSESQYAQSPADFITKLHIALKEAGETRSWLHLLWEKGVLLDKEYNSINNDCSELIAILVASLNTIKKNINID